MRPTTVQKVFLAIFGGMFLLLVVSGEIESARQVAAVLVTVGLLWFANWWFRVRPLRDAYTDVAQRLHLRYHEADTLGLLSLPHPLLHRLAQVRSLDHVLEGTWQGRAIVAFKYTYTTNSDDQDDYQMISCALTPVPASWPAIVIEPERPLTEVPDALGLGDIDFESERFNRAYEVRCADRRFASALVDARMMAWLLDTVPGYGFQVADHRLLVFGAKVYPWEIESILGVAAGFLQQVPGVVATLYPA